MKKTVPLIIGNWKLNPVALDEALIIAASVSKKFKNSPEPYVSVAPPVVYLNEVGKKIKKSSLALTAQDLSHETMGPFTGEVSVRQLKDLGVESVIVGHSERRALGESDEMVRQKVQLALKYRIIPIVCIGEKERDEHGDFFTFIEDQLRSLAEVLPAVTIKKVVIAYEPIWAIGTGKVATAEDVKEMQLFMESVLTKLYDRATAKAVRLIYGGSVRSKNVADIHKNGGMRGFLVGGASLKADEFLEIVKLVSS